LCARWYLRYALSYRDLEELMRERSLSVAHTTIYRWIQAYAPVLERRIRPHLRPTNESYRVNETYVKIKGVWKYLYRAVDSTGQTIDFMLSAKRDTKAAKRVFRKMLKATSHASPRVINVDKNQAYPPAVERLKQEGILSNRTQLRQCKYLNNLIEQDHRFIKRRVNPGLGFFSFKTARRTIKGFETMIMIRKGRIDGVGIGRISEKSAASANDLKNPRYRIVLVAHLLQIAFSPALSSSSINASSFDQNNYTAEGLPRREWATKMIEIGLQPSSAIDRLRAALAVARRRGRRAEEGGQQHEMHLPGLRAERMGEARLRADLRGVLLIRARSTSWRLALSKHSCHQGQSGSRNQRATFCF
jgi:IS6 family transposase